MGALDVADGFGAAQQGFDAGHQFARAEGLGDVIVRAHFQADHAVGLFSACGEHQDRQAIEPRVAPDLLADLQPR